MSDKENTGFTQAQAQAASICAMVAALGVDYDRLQELRDEREEFGDSPEWSQTYPAESAELAELEEAAGDCESEEEARERIQEDALSVEVRSDWCNPGETMEAGEFRIVLCTGGPHVEIVGDLNQGEPSRPRILYRDWGESGELFDFDHDVVTRYCSCFYFGE